MSTKNHSWITLWFLLSSPVIILDLTYCLMRPRSMEGGDLHWLWKPYGFYQHVDHLYGMEAYERMDGFPNAQSLMNIPETLLNLYYVYLQHVSGSHAAPLFGFSGALMTFSKTALYWAQEYYCGRCETGHLSTRDFWAYWLFPSGLWIVVPLLIVYTLGKDIIHMMRIADRLQTGKKE